MSQRLPSTEGPTQHQAYDKFRYPLRVHMKSLTNIPHSAPSVRSQKQQTYFPSVATTYKDNKKSVMSRQESHAAGDEGEEEEEMTLQEELHDRHLNEMLKKLNQRGKPSLFSHP